MPNCSEEGNDRSFNPASDRGNVNVSDACSPESIAGAEFDQSPLRKYRSFDVYGVSTVREDISYQRRTCSVQSEPANFYSSAVETRELSGRSQPLSSVVRKEYNLVSTEGNNAHDFIGQHTPHSPKSEKYEEISATVELSEEIDDDDHLYGSYAETDLDNLDQTTDFSQKYKEHFDSYRNYGNSQLDETDNMESFPFPNEEGAFPFHQDTVKVYCTEGTPLFISTASSLTDLREIGESGGSTQKSRRRSLREPKEGQIEESEGESFNSDAAAAGRNDDTAEKEKSGGSLRVPSVKEGKTVTFGEEVSLADETPLMFSRSSSLGSLSSFEQQGMQEDRLTVGSFSQQTSGNISPSDLPDSPSETMPPSPRRPSRQAVFHLPPYVRPLPPPVNCVFREVPRSFAEEGTPCRISQATSLSSLAVDDEQCINEEMCPPRQSTSKNVFNDVKHRFAEEGTPCRISRAESLSPLPLDDDCADDGAIASPVSRKQISSVDEIGGVMQTEQEASGRTGSPRRENLTVGDGSLQGIQPGTKQRSDFPVFDIGNKIKSFENLEAADGHRRMQRVDERMENVFGASCIEERRLPYGYTRVANATLSFSTDRKPLEERTLGPEDSWIAEGKDGEGSDNPKHPTKHVTFSPSYASQPPTFADDSTRTYCTEDTPANLSHAASYSDLSSINGERSLQALDDWDSDDNGSDILAECIQLGKSTTMRNGSTQKAKKVATNGHGGGSQNVHSPSKLERDFSAMRLSSPARIATSVTYRPQDALLEKETSLDKEHGDHFGNGRTINNDERNTASSTTSACNEKDGRFRCSSPAPLCNTNLADGDTTVENLEQHPKPDNTGSSNNTDSDAGKSSGKLELSDDDVDDSEILAEVIRLGMPKSDGLSVGSPVRVTAILPRTAPSKGTYRAAPKELLDDEADDRRLLEEVINLGKQQLRLSSPSISRSVTDEGHSSRPRTKERRANLQPRTRETTLINGSAALHCNAQLYRARSSESHACRTRKPNPVVHYERSASEKRQNPLAFRRNDTGFASDRGELHGGQGYGFKQVTTVHKNCVPHQKPFFAHGRPPRIAHEARNYECTPLSPSRLPKPPSRQPTQPAQFNKDFDSDSENEVDDAKLLREVIMLGTPGLSGVSPKLPVLRKQAKPSDVTNNESSSTDDETLLREVIQLGKSKVLAASKASSTAPDCGVSETKSLCPETYLASGDNGDGSETNEIREKAETAAETDVLVVPESSESATEKQTDTRGAEDVAKETGPPTETDNAVRASPPLTQSSVSSEKPLSSGSTSTLTGVAKSQAPKSEVAETKDCGASTEKGTVPQKEQLDMPPEPPADSPERITAIRIKLPDGRALTRRFLAAWELRVLLSFLSYLGYPVEKFKIIKNWRRQELSISNPRQTLEQLKLYPKKTLTIKER